MQFIIYAYDGKDEGAKERRMAARPDHLENLKHITGKVVCAGGLIGSEGFAIGSFMVMEFESQALFDAYLENEPYVKKGVWQDIKVEHANVVILKDERVGQ